MALELEGTLRQKLGVQQGTSARGQWAKQEFILEYPDGNYTSKDQVGDRVKVSFNLKSREYNGRWYTDVSIWRISPAGEAAAPSARPAATASAPISAPPVGDIPAPTLDDMPADSAEADDLPF